MRARLVVALALLLAFVPSAFAAPQATRSYIPEADTWVRSNLATSQYATANLRSGLFGAGVVNRSFLRFNQGAVDDLASKNVISAQLRLYGTEAGACDRRVEARRLTSGFTSSTVWSNQPTASSTTEGATIQGAGGPSCADGWVSIPVTKATIDGWADGVVLNHGMLVRASNEADGLGWRIFSALESASTDPQLVVTYNTAPAVPVLSAPAAGASGACDPTLSASFSDVEGGEGRVDFQVLDSSGALVVGGSANSAAGQANWKVPRNADGTCKLAAGQSYSWRARAYDGRDYSGWSAGRGYSVASAAPATPASPSPTSGASLGTLTPTLSATYADPDGGSGELEFQLRTASGDWVGSGYARNVSSGTRGAWQVPQGLLREGERYTWTVKAFDGALSSPWTASSTFTVDTCDRYADAGLGVDVNDGSSASPVKTPGRLAAVTQSGEVGCFRAGTYEQTDVRIIRNDVRFTSAPGPRAVWRGRIVIDGDRVELNRLDLDGSTGTSCGPGASESCRAVLPSPVIHGDDVGLRENDITSPGGGICVHPVEAGGLSPERFSVTRNRIHHCGLRDGTASTNWDHGIYVGNGVAGRIEDNVLFDNADRGIKLGPKAYGTTVQRNTLNGNQTGGLSFSGDSTPYTADSRDNLVKNNTVTNSELGLNAHAYNLGGQGNSFIDNCASGGSKDTPGSPGGVDFSDVREGASVVASGTVATPPAYQDAANDNFAVLSGPCATRSAPADVAAPAQFR